MSFVFKSLTALVGAVTLAALPLSLTQPAAAAPGAKSKHYCERICVGGACFNSCSEIQPNKKTTYRTPGANPEAPPRDWREVAFESNGGDGGGGGGGNR